MARPPLPDRAAVTSASLSVRLTAEERTRWDVLVAQRATELKGTGGRVTAASLARDVLVAHLDAAGITLDDVPPPIAPPAPAQPTLALPGLDAPAPTAAPAPSTPPASFWFGISEAGAVEWIQPRQASRDDMETACREQGLTLRGPFETRESAWTAFDREREDKLARVVPPPPPLPPAAPPAPASAAATEPPSAEALAAEPAEPPAPAPATTSSASRSTKSAPAPATSARKPTAKTTATASTPARKPATKTNAAAKTTGRKLTAKQSGKKPRR